MVCPVEILEYFEDDVGVFAVDGTALGDVGAKDLASSLPDEVVRV